MYSSTTLEGSRKSGCWKQVSYAEANTPSLFPLEYRSYLGQAAHAVLQICAARRTEKEADIRQTAEEVAHLLISEGRTFRGHQEPPLPAEDVYQGVDVAVHYMLGRGLNLEADILIPERDWEHPTIPFRALIDLVSVYDEGEEEYSRRVTEVADWKSSWQAGADELNTLQRWGQTVVMWRVIQNKPVIWHGQPVEIDIIRQRVVNLRTWQEFTRDIDLADPEQISELERWERRIGDMCKTADSMRCEMHIDTGTFDHRPASPGVGCLSCAWRHVCEDVWPTSAAVTGLLSTEELAVALAQLEGQRSLIIAALKAADVEKPIKIPGGYVGFREQVRRFMAQGKESAILDEWLERTACEVPEADRGVLVSLLSALKLGKGNLDELAKALMPERKKGIGQLRGEYVETLTVEKRQSVFGVWNDE